MKQRTYREELNMLVQRRKIKRVHYRTKTKHHKGTLTVACKRKRISGCRLSPPKIFGGDKRKPEIRLRSQTTLTATTVNCWCTIWTQNHPTRKRLKYITQHDVQNGDTRLTINWYPLLITERHNHTKLPEGPCLTNRYCSQCNVLSSPPLSNFQFNW